MTHTDGLAIAIDVGGTGIKCALVAATGAMIHTERHPTHAERGPDAVVATVADIASGLAARAATHGHTVVRAGVVIPGVVDEARGVAVWSANLGLREVPLRDDLAKRLDLPVALGHDVRAAALAEARVGAGRTARRMLFVAIGTGIAGGYVLDGHVDPGSHGAAGEIGHISVRTGAEARPCGCGARGCLEAHASAAAVGRAYAAAASLSAGETSAGEPCAGEASAGEASAGEESAGEASAGEASAGEASAGATAAAAGGALRPAMGAREVTEAMEQGDLVAAAVWREATEALADGLLTAVALYNPELIVLGGGLAEAGDLLLRPVRENLERRATFHRLPELSRSHLGDQAGCHGAALLAWDLAA